MFATTPTRRTAATPTVRRPRPGESCVARPEAAGDRELLAPVAASTTRHRWPRGLPCVTRRPAVAMLVMSLVVLLGGTYAVSAAASSDPAAAQLTSASPLPVPTVGSCPPDPPLPVCAPAPTMTPSAAGVPLPIPTAPANAVTCFPGSLQSECQQPSATASVPPPCAGEGCIPQFATSAPAPTNSSTGQPGDGGDKDADCGITNIGGCVTGAINAFFRGVVEEALNPLLDLLSTTVLTTPTPDSIPRVEELWHDSWQILLASYALLVVIAGAVVMAYETLQTRHGIKEIAPRVVVGFLAGALSLWLATKGIEIANALAQAVMSGGVDPASAADTLKNLVLGSLNGGIFVVFVGIFLAGMLVVVLITYIVRVALTLLLIAGAPLALMCHALPQTEGVAYWWYQVYGGVLVIQVGQSFTLIIAFRVFLAPGGFTLFGPTVSGLVNLLVALALMYILIKIPFWVLGSMRRGRGHSLVGLFLRGFFAYKTFNLLGGGRAGGGGGRGPLPSGGGQPRPGSSGGGPNHPNPNRGGPRQKPHQGGPRPRGGPQGGGPHGHPNPHQGGGHGQGGPNQGKPNHGGPNRGRPNRGRPVPNPNRGRPYRRGPLPNPPWGQPNQRGNPLPPPNQGRPTGGRPSPRGGRPGGGGWPPPSRPRPRPARPPFPPPPRPRRRWP